MICVGFFYYMTGAPEGSPKVVLCGFMVFYGEAGNRPCDPWFTRHSAYPLHHGGFFVDLLCFCSVLCLLCLCARLFICALWSPAGKGLTSWLSFVVSTVSLSLSHWYPGSGVVLDCIDS